MASALEPLFLAWVDSTLFAMEKILDSASASDVCRCILNDNKHRLEELGRRMFSQGDKLESSHSLPQTQSQRNHDFLKVDDAFKLTTLSEDHSRRGDRRPSTSTNGTIRSLRPHTLASCDEASAWFQLRHDEAIISAMPSRKPMRRFPIWCMSATMRRAVHYSVWIARLYAVVGTSFVGTFLGAGSPSSSFAEVICEALLLVGVFIPAPLFLCQKSCNRRERAHSTFTSVHIPSVWRFLDIVSAIPWHSFWLCFGYDSFLTLSFVRLVQFFRLAHVIVISGGTGIYMYNISIHPDLLRVVGLAAMYFLLVHLCACGYRFLAVSGDHTLWGLGALQYSNPVEAYLNALFWSIEALSFGNIDPPPSSWLELVYSSVTVFAGIFLTSGIVGIIASLMGRIDELSSRRRAKWDSIERCLRKNRISSDLCMAIRQYYVYYNAPSRPTIDPGLLTELSTSLRLKLNLCLYSKFIQQCALFESCPARCVVDLIDVICRNRVILMPLERIFKQGELGNDMYFVVRGEIVVYIRADVSVCTQEDLKRIAEMSVSEGNDFATVIARLSPGESFGEMALIYERPRAANALSIVWSEVLVMPRDEFHAALDAYPDFAQRILEQSRQTLSCVSVALGDNRSSREVELAVENDAGGLDRNVTIV